MVAAIVARSPEFERVSRLPVRVWSQEQILWAIQVMSSKLCYTGRETLLPGQAVALYEIAHLKGLFGPMVVGSGKTGVSLLAGTVSGAKRPLILSTPSALRGTENAAKQWRQNWAVPSFLKFATYNFLGRRENKDFLNEYRPDCLILDEGHKARNTGAGVTKVIKAYLKRNTGCMVIVLSGTITKDSIRDYAHLTKLTSRFSGYNPLPENYGDLESWALCLDVEKTFMKKPRPDIGAFRDWIIPEDQVDSYDPYVWTQRAFRRRLNSTPGVVRLGDSRDGVDASLIMRSLEFPQDTPVCIQALADLRKTWKRPDGWRLAEASQVWYVARCMALGFYLRLKVPPPEGYLDARAEWSDMARKYIAGGHATTEGDAAIQLAETPEYQTWAAYQAVYKPETEPVWFSGHALEYVARWMRENGKFKLDSGETHCAIVWVEQPDFGRALSHITGAPFYYKNGCDVLGNFAENHDPETGPAICSIKSCGTGLNLQGLHRMAASRALFVSTSGGSQGIEQPVARIHRRMQRADVVEIFFLMTCSESHRAIEKAQEEAAYEKNTVGNEFKILYADVLIDPPSRYNAMWGRTENKPTLEKD